MPRGLTIQIVKQPNQCKYLVTSSPSTNLYGSVDMVRIIVDLSDNSTVQFTLLMENKTSTRLPEAHWFSFYPIVKNSNINNWFVNKVSNLIPINNGIINGSKHLHGTINGVYYNNSLNIMSLDNGIVSLDIQSPFSTPFSDDLINPINGIHFLLNNNIWNTNYPSWYPFLNEDINLVYRFNLTINGKQYVVV